MKIQTPSPEPNWRHPTCKSAVSTPGQICHGNHIVVMDVRTPNPEHLSSNNEETCCSVQETGPHIDEIIFGADHNESLKKLELTPSNPIGIDVNTTRKIYHSHQGILMLPSPEIDSIDEEAHHTPRELLQCSASQTGDENGIKIVATPSPEHCNEKQGRAEYDEAPLAQSPHFIGRSTTLKATSPLYSGRHKKRHCSRPSSQSPAFLSLWAREDARQVKGQGGGQILRHPSNYFYVEQREYSNPCSLEMETHLRKALDLQDEGSQAPQSPPANCFVTPITPNEINNSAADDNQPQHVPNGHGDRTSSLPIDYHSNPRKGSSNSKRPTPERSPLNSSPESPPPPINWLTTISNQTKTFNVINNNNNCSEVRLQPEDIKSSILIGQVGRKFLLVSLLPSGVRGDGFLLCIDQHAADERIQLESLEIAVAEKRESGALKSHHIHHPPEFTVMAEGMLYHSQYAHHVIIG